MSRTIKYRAWDSFAKKFKYVNKELYIPEEGRGNEGSGGRPERSPGYQGHRRGQRKKREDNGRILFGRGTRAAPGNADPKVK